ncbi:MAG: PQQ-binding-like beta-propeller repeat protein [Acidobacteria bacterium]|nr:PQQ-binding-like beta-propeller repeat protein [Acidobacteriota bacterium]
MISKYAESNCKNSGPLGRRRRLFAAVLLLFAGAWLTQPRTGAAQGRNSTLDAIAAEFPYQYLPQNLPSASLARYYPQTWTTYASNQGRNAVFALMEGAPSALREGVRWQFAGAGAIPLDGPPIDNNVVTTAYGVGMPVGVSVVKGITYVGSDNGYTYALNAVTGKLIWAHYGWNMSMSNPLVVDGRVYVSTGSAYFNYANTMLYVEGKRPTRGPGLNSMYALDARTGKEIWVYHFPGEAMPTAAYENGFLYIGTGDGHVYKLNAATGKPAWISDIVSFVSMSSPVLDNKYLFVGGTHPNFFYALDRKTGKVAWKTTLPKLVATGMGDATPAYQDGIVVQEATVQTGNPQKPVANVLLALDANTGKIIWKHRFGKGPVPPAMKTATPMIAEGKVFEGSPVTGNYYAFDLKTGCELWRVHLGAQIRAGGALANGIVYVPYKAGDIAAIRIADGTLIGNKHIGGAFGPSSPVIVGGTLYVTNIFGYVLAIPISDIPGPVRTVQQRAPAR